jgi:serine/threonine protein kinase
MAEVWLARATGAKGFQKTVVVKTILPHLADDPDFMNMFVNEALLASVLDHPNIVQIFDLGQIGERYYIAMEYIVGRTLRQVQRVLRKQHKVMPIWFVLRVAIAVCDALDYAHTKRGDDGALLGFVHRDITPENIMISFTGVTKVVDFGIAKATAGAAITQGGKIKGKLSYLAPEQILPHTKSRVDGRTDIYALGIVLYEMLTGVRPFRAANDIALLLKIPKEIPTPPCEIARWVPQRLSAIVMRALEKKMDARYQTAKEMGAEIESYLTSVGMYPAERQIGEYMTKLFSEESRAQAERTSVEDHEVVRDSVDLSPSKSDIEGPDSAVSITIDVKDEDVLGTSGALATQRVPSESSGEESGVKVVAEARAAGAAAPAKPDAPQGATKQATAQTPRPPPPVPHDVTPSKKGHANATPKSAPPEPAAARKPARAAPAPVRPAPAQQRPSDLPVNLAIEVETEGLDIEVPKLEVEVPKLEVDVPKLGVDVPKLEVEVPKLEVEVPSVPVVAALSTAVAKPVVDIDFLGIGASAPGVEVEAPGQVAPAKPTPSEAAPDGAAPPKSTVPAKGASSKPAREEAGPPTRDAAWSPRPSYSIAWDRLVERAAVDVAQTGPEGAEAKGEENAPENLREQAAEQRDTARQGWDALVQRLNVETDKTEAPAVGDEAPEPARPGGEVTRHLHAWDAVMKSQQPEPPPFKASASAPPPPPRKGWHKYVEPEFEAAKRFDEGLALMKTGDREGALRAWEDAVGLCPDNKKYLSNLRLLRRALGRRDDRKE